MFTHVKDLQFEASPDGPDPAFARRFQEVLGGKWGEMTVAMQYPRLFGTGSGDGDGPSLLQKAKDALT